MKTVTFIFAGGNISVDLTPEDAAGIIDLWKVGSWINVTTETGEALTVNSGLLVAIKVGA